MTGTNVDTTQHGSRHHGGTIRRFTCPENTVGRISGAYSSSPAMPTTSATWCSCTATGTTAPLSFKAQDAGALQPATTRTPSGTAAQMTFGDGGHHLLSAGKPGCSSPRGEPWLHQAELRTGLLSGQSGGISEAFSDAWREATECLRGSNDWLAALESLAGQQLRYFRQDPAQDSKSISPHKRYYDLDVHTVRVCNPRPSCLAQAQLWRLANRKGVRKCSCWPTAPLPGPQHRLHDQGSVRGDRRKPPDLGYSNERAMAAAFTAVGVAPADTAPTRQPSLQNRVPVTISPPPRTKARTSTVEVHPRQLRNSWWRDSSNGLAGMRIST